MLSRLPSFRHKAAGCPCRFDAEIELLKEKAGRARTVSPAGTTCVIDSSAALISAQMTCS